MPLVLEDVLSLYSAKTAFLESRRMTPQARRRAAANAARVRALRARRGLYKTPKTASERRELDLRAGRETTDEAHGGIPSNARFLRLEHFQQVGTTGRSKLRFAPSSEESWHMNPSAAWPRGRTPRWYWHRVTRAAPLPRAGDTLELTGVTAHTTGSDGMARVIEITESFRSARGTRDCTGMCVLKLL